MASGGVTYIRRDQAEQLILKTCGQFSRTLEQLNEIRRGHGGREAEAIGQIYEEYSAAVGGSHGNAELEKKLETGLGQELRDAGREELEDMLRECGELARGYDLPVRGDLPDGEIRITHECPAMDFSDFYSSIMNCSTFGISNLVLSETLRDKIKKIKGRKQI